MTAPPVLRRFPWSPRLAVSDDAGRAARRVRLLTGASDRRRELLDRVGAATIAVTGTRPLRRTARLGWTGTPIECLVAELDRWLPGIRVDGVVFPRQPGRMRLSVLGQVDRRDVVVKLGEPGDGIEHEALVLGLLADRPLPSIATPAVVAAGHLAAGTIAFVATDAIGLDGQRPALGEPLLAFECDLAASLAALPRPAGTPRGSTPVHGDLAPWNLRRTRRGLALFDWEAAGWGQPGADVDHYRRACASVRS